MAVKESKLQHFHKGDQLILQCVERASMAAQQFSAMTQETIDEIVQRMALAGISRHMELAKLELEETKRGVFEDKMLKNMYATESIYHQLKYMRTVGEIENNQYEQYKVIAEPIGTIVALISDTSPVATTLYQCLVAMKTRNPIIFIFQKEVSRCGVEAVQSMMDAAILTGSPPFSIQWMEQSNHAATLQLMAHDEVALVIANGDEYLLKAAMQLGKSTLSVSYGNVPCYIERTADLKQAVTDLLLSKNFDNSMTFTAEQALLVDLEIYHQTTRMMQALGCYFLDVEESNLLASHIFNEQGALKNNFVGKSAVEIALAAELSIPEDTKLLVVMQDQIGISFPFSGVMACPILALYKVDNDDIAIALAQELIELGHGKHSAVIHSHNEQIIQKFSERLSSNRVLVNAPSTQTAMNQSEHEQMPFASLGYQCYTNNQHVNMELIHLKHVAKRKVDMQWFKIPPKLYFSAGATQYLTKMPDIHRIMIVTDHNMERLGYVNKIQYFLLKRSEPVQIEIFAEVEHEPTIDIVMQGTARMNAFQPDCIVALGGGSAIDAAKAMWLFYESPDTNFDTIKMKFMNIRNRVYKYPHLGKRAKLVAIPTTSGTGSEVTSFATITDIKKGHSKYPLADYELTPDVAIIDSEYTGTLSKVVIADTGMDVLTHAIEAYVSIMANDFSDGLAIKAIQLVLENLEKSYATADPVAREKMHNASTIAGMAFSNVFLGICHSLSHKLSAEFQLPHGRANAILLPHIIRYNASKPTKFQNFSNYKHFQADTRYAEIARLSGLPAQSTSEGVNSLIHSIRQLNRSLGIPDSFQRCGISATSFESKVEYLAERAFEDQYTNYNPRLPLVSELTQLYRQAFYGEYQ